jgi:hypothetical protein
MTVSQGGQNGIEGHHETNGETNGCSEVKGHTNGVSNGDNVQSSQNVNAPSSTIPKFEMPKEPIAKGPALGIHTHSLFDLSGKTALVTGGNGGIGSAMARGLAEAGTDIIIFQIPGEKSKFHTQLSAETGRKVWVYDCDLGDTPSIRRTVQQVIDDGHGIDILCNVAGISSGSIPILHETDEHKDSVSLSQQLRSEDVQDLETN